MAFNKEYEYVKAKREAVVNVAKNEWKENLLAVVPDETSFMSKIINPAIAGYTAEAPADWAVKYEINLRRVKYEDWKNALDPERWASGILAKEVKYKHFYELKTDFFVYLDQKAEVVSDPYKRTTFSSLMNKYFHKLVNEYLKARFGLTNDPATVKNELSTKLQSYCGLDATTADNIANDVATLAQNYANSY